MAKIKKILVIGGTGFIGFHVVKEAKSRGMLVTSISLHKPIKSRCVKGVNYLTIDVLDIEKLKKKIKSKFEFVVNAGGYGKHPNFGKDGNKLVNSHFNGLMNIVDIVDKKNLKKFIQIGSSAEYGKAKPPFKEKDKCFPTTPYGIAKLSCSNFLQNLNVNYGYPSVILRVFQVYGPNQAQNRILPFIIKKCLKDKEFQTTYGNQLSDFCHINDVVKAIFKVLHKKNISGEIFNISSGKPMKIKKVILLVRKLIGKGKPLFGALNYKKGMNMKNFPSIKKAKSKLGWKPELKLRDGLIETIKSYS